MVVRRSIGDWFANAEGRYTEDSRYDWENDDHPDQTPDSWLDRPSSSRMAAARTSPSDRPGQQAIRTAKRPKRSARMTPEQLAAAARDLQRQVPGIGAKAIARRIRGQGWSEVTPMAVEQVLAQPPKLGVRPPQRTRGAAPGGTHSSSKKKPKTPSSRQKGGTAEPSRFEIAVHLLRRDAPRLDVEEMTDLLRYWGWHGATRTSVKAALKKNVPPSALSPNGDFRTFAKSCAERPVQRQVAVPPPRPRSPRVDVCQSCGVRPSTLGICRCS